MRSLIVLVLACHLAALCSGTIANGLLRVKLIKKQRPHSAFRHLRRPESVLGDESLTNWYESYYAGEVQVGTPPQKFMVDMDTGSQTLWLTTADCQGKCPDNRFAPEASSTFTNINEPFRIRYGDQTTATGYWGTDSVSVAGVGIATQPVALANFTNATSQGYDGLMGLGWPYYPTDKPPVMALFKQHPELPSKFAMYLSNTVGEGGGEIMFGNIDESVYQPPLLTVPMTSPNWWQTNMTSFIVGGVQYQYRVIPALIDSGTSWFLGPADVINPVLEQIMEAAADDIMINDQVLLISCDKGLAMYPKLQVRLMQYTFVLVPSDYISDPVQDDDPTINGKCLVRIGGFDDDLFILGDVFMRRVFTIFDVGQKAMHLAYVKGTTF